MDKAGRNYVSCDIVKASSNDKANNGFEFPALVFSTRLVRKDKPEDSTTFNVKFGFKSCSVVRDIIDDFIRLNPTYA